MFFISAVVAVYNDPEGIKTTLDSLLSQDYPKKSFDIIVVDNNSSDNTRDVVNNYVKKYPKNISLLAEDTIQSSYAARNKGIRVARGEVLAFIDSDMWADRSWFSTISNSFKDNEIGYAGFGIEIHPTRRTLVGVYNKLTGFPVKEYLEERHFAGAGCIAVRRSVFKKFGLFDSQLISGGDFEFGNRCWQKGVKQLFVKGVSLHHPARESMASLVKKQFRIGRGKRQLIHRYPGIQNNRGLNLRDFTPPNPLKFFNKDFYLNKGMKIKDFKPTERLNLYFIDWVSKSSRILGYFYESMHDKEK